MKKKLCLECVERETSNSNDGLTLIRRDDYAYGNRVDVAIFYRCKTCRSKWINRIQYYSGADSNNDFGSARFEGEEN